MAEGGASRRVLDEQIAYYRARAAEYDQWFLRQGRYDRGPADNADWFREIDDVRRALSQSALTGDVLEFASGTGLWTECVLRQAATVTAVDSSPETIEINRRCCPPGRVRYVEADIFNWRPDRAYDAVFFGFWLSHVPDARLDDFLALVHASLRPGGRFFFVDSKREGAVIATARDNIVPGLGGTIARRTLNDGRAFDVVKIFYEPKALSDRFAQCGLIADITETDRFFIFGQGRRA